MLKEKEQVVGYKGRQGRRGQVKNGKEEWREEGRKEGKERERRGERWKEREPTTNKNQSCRQRTGGNRRAEQQEEKQLSIRHQTVHSKQWKKKRALVLASALNNSLCDSGSVPSPFWTSVCPSVT